MAHENDFNGTSTSLYQYLKRWSVYRKVHAVLDGDVTVVLLGHDPLVVTAVLHAQVLQFSRIHQIKAIIQYQLPKTDLRVSYRVHSYRV